LETGNKTSNNCQWPVSKPKSEDIINDLIELVQFSYRECRFCIRDCRVNRLGGEIGFCGNPADTTIYSNQLSQVEESFISPCYEIYMTGCNISCKYCHQASFRQYNSTEEYIPIQYVIEDIIKQKNDIKTISFLGGNPDQRLLTALKITQQLLQHNINIPIVWNSNFLFSHSMTPILDTFVDVYIPDIKFWDSDCSEKICGLASYRDKVVENILSVRSDNLIIIRHLPLEGHWSCCTEPILNWVAGINTNQKIFLSLLTSLFTDNQTELDRAMQLGDSLNIQVIRD